MLADIRKLLYICEQVAPLYMQEIQRNIQFWEGTIKRFKVEYERQTKKRNQLLKQDYHKEKISANTTHKS